MKSWLLLAALLGGCATSGPYTFGERPKPARTAYRTPEREARDRAESIGQMVYWIVGVASPRTVQ